MKIQLSNLRKNSSIENFSRFNFVPKVSQVLFISFIVVFATSFISYTKDEGLPKEKLPVFGTCQPVAVTEGIVQFSNDKTITYQTNGGGKIIIDQKKCGWRFIIGTIQISKLSFEDRLLNLGKMSLLASRKV